MTKKRPDWASPEEVLSTLDEQINHEPDAIRCELLWLQRMLVAQGMQIAELRLTADMILEKLTGAGR